MSATQEKMRALRLKRLETTLATRLDNPSAALEVLITELSIHEPQTPLWEALHAAAARDGLDQDMAQAYVKIATGRRLQQLEPQAQADFLTHAADFYQGVLGDAASAENFLERVLHIVPGHQEAFKRLELRLKMLHDSRRLIELYALYAATRPPGVDDLVSKAVNMIVPLPASSPLSDDACKNFAKLASTHPILLEVLEAHCRKTKRFGLACQFLELAVEQPNLPRATEVEQRRHLVKLYTGEAASPANAMPHVEALLEHDPADEVARSAAERLLSTKQVAARAAAALQKARRQARH